MTPPRQFPISELIDEMRLLVAGREAWLDMARKGHIKRTPMDIEHKAEGLERMKAIGNILVGLSRQEMKKGGG